MQILLSSNKQILKNYIKPNTKVGFIPTASEIDDDRWYMERDRNDLEKMGYELVNIEISSEPKEKIIELFNSLDAIVVDGGNAFYLLQQLKLKDVLSNLINFAKNKIYVGISAGSCIACPSIDYLDTLDNKEDAPKLSSCDSLNLIDAYILPHYKSSDEYTELINKTTDKYKNLNFILLTNNQAVIAENKTYKIVDTK